MIISDTDPSEFISDPLDEVGSTAPFGTYTKCSSEMCVYYPYEICPLSSNSK